MKVIAVKTRVFKEGEDLFSFICGYIKKLPEKAVLVVTSKIVALAEKRTADVKNAKTKEKLIRQESQFVMPTKYVWLTIKEGMLMASAGIDESNANGKLILLPKDSFKTAHILRKKLKQKYRVKNLGILITDSRTIPLRLGINGVALGYAGFLGVRDYVGKPDIFGRKFKFERTGIADCLATAAVLVMGEGNEQQPLAIIGEAPIQFCEKVNKNELRIDVEDDMYRPFFSQLKSKKQ
ncbi:MAG: hypothetical protein EXS52_00115 [Candidatus Staskawiczbacteria bacterium]|nr:hypothetical protein [Candidatus Staskawiczbacteria bacterium]